jgi:hypothetical protein
MARRRNIKYIKETLDQGRLHPKLEVLRLTCLGVNQTQASAVEDEHSSYSNSVLKAIRKIYILHISLRKTNLFALRRYQQPPPPPRSLTVFLLSIWKLEAFPVLARCTMVVMYVANYGDIKKA